MRRASGTTISIVTRKRDRPSACPASIWPRNGADAATHDLGDEGGFEERERAGERHEFGNDVEAAAKIETLQMRNAEARLRAAGDDRRGRQEDERQGREPSVERKAARRDAAPSREAPEPDAEGSTEQERSDRPPRRPVEGQRW